jgi:hypothetical protein
MSEASASTQSGPDDELERPEDLQFDQAEYTTPAPSGPSCESCHNLIVDEYFEANGKIFCASCRQGIERHLRGGSALARVFKSVVLGSVAAAAGAVLYYLVTRTTGYNIGLISVLVGFMVGAAVRKGTGNRGGLLYQFLALFLTYIAIGAMNLTFNLEALGKIEAEQKANKAVAVPGKGEGQPAPKKAEETEPAGPQRGEKKDQAPEVRLPSTSLGLLILYVVVLFSSPVLEAIDAPISGLIYGFALWEAWKLNKRLTLSFNGPFRVSTGGATGVAPEVAGDGD